MPEPASDELYRQVVEAAPSAMVMADRAGTIVLVNRQAERLFGYPREELVGRPVEVLVPEAFRARHPAHREGYAAAPRERLMGAGRDLYGQRKDGSQVPVEIGLNPITVGGVAYVLAAVVDITERKKAEERFRLAVEAAPNAMLMIDAGGRIVLANGQTGRLFGYADGELVGQTLETLIPPRFRKSHPALRAGFTASPSTRPMGAGRELFGWHKEGREFPVEIGLNPIRAGEETYVLAAIVDVSERQELQRRVAQNEALAAIGSMSAVMAHEIRNPLGSIVMAAKSLSRGDLSAEDRALVSVILSEESQRLSRTLQDFLHFARPREPVRQTADLNRQVAELVSVLTADQELARRVRVETALDPALPPFAYDPDQLRQVLWNLMLNAIQAMGGDGSLRVSTAVSGREAVLTVTDSGPGIPADSLPKIFDPFFTTKTKGTGLGLAIARRIVGAHGGALRASNPAGGGACFELSLPLGSAPSGRTVA